MLPIVDARRGPDELLGLTSDEVVRRAEARAMGAGRALDIYRRAVRDARYEPDAFGLKRTSVDAWRETFQLTLPEVVRVIAEPTDLGEDTVKVVLRLADGLELECVRIPMGGGRSTLCVSSQVGCKLACKFCETAKMGLLRNLTAAEIVSQVVVARAVLGWQIWNIVFMGMGEPLDNVENLVQALKVLNDPKGLHIGQQHLRITTVGLPDGIRRLGALGWKRMDLSISLNGATDEKRSKVMPINRQFPLAELQASLLAYPRRKSFVFGVNYCLMPGLNDTREDAKAITAFCRPLERVLVNVIPYNPGTDPLTRAPTEEEIDQFIDWLIEDKLAVRRRITKGRSVMAACGQLGNLELRKALRAEQRSRARQDLDELVDHPQREAPEDAVSDRVAG
ncbi:23S rRNA (adenine(2503)-C(2))-methyltransferase RlmN [Myxococcota bacterium]|nr:23S rRNA (adenine(2503)-C(2))-methyltransferase RlmN [Myxococcota bacterium]